MNPLQLRLASLRFRMILVNFWRGSCTLFAVIAGILFIEGLADWKLHFPAALRGFFLVGTLVAGAVIFIRYLYWPMTHRLNDLSLALRIEEIYPELNDNLASAVQFLDEPEDNLTGSKVIRQHAIEHALKRADHCDFGNIIDRRGVFLCPLAALIVALVAAHFAYHYPTFTWKAITRLVDPFGSHAWTEIDLDDALPRHIAQGQRFIVKGQLAGIIPEKARLELDGTVGQPDKLFNIKPGEAFTGTFQTAIDLPAKVKKFRFRILANDGTYPAHGGWTHWIDVQTPPRLVPMEDGQLSPQVELEYPAYTDLPSPEKLSPGPEPQFEAVAGTKVRWRAAVDRPIVQAWLELDQPGGNVQIPCQIDAHGKLFSVEFTPPTTVTGARVHFKDALDLSNFDKIDLKIIPDPAPTVHLKKPTWSIEKILPDAQVTLEIAAADKLYSLRSVYLEYRRKSSNGIDWVDPQWNRVPIAHAEMAGLFVMLGQNFHGRALPAHIRPQFLELTFPWHLLNQFKEGEIVCFQVCADDFNNSVGRSREFEIVIVGKRDFQQNLDQEFEKIQRQIVNLRQEQDAALKTVKDLQADKDADPKEKRDKLNEAKEKQQSIKNIIGGQPDEGLRKTLNELKEKLRENKLPSSELLDNVNALSNELERLARVDLPQIEDNLANALRQIANPPAKSDTKPDNKIEQKDNKIEQKKKDSLDQARIFQEDAARTLAELEKFLNPWANQQQIKDKIIKLAAEQKNLKREIEALSAKNDAKGMPPTKADLDPRAERQDLLAKQADELLNTIKDVLAKQKGSDAAEKLNEVAKIANQADIPNKMRNISGQLRNTEKPNLKDSAQNQGKIIDELDKMLAALDEKDRGEQLDKLVRKRKEAQKDLNQLQDNMAKLERKINDAKKLTDPQQRADALRQLAPEQQKLEDEAHKLARELARLQADKAARDLERAAQEMANAGKQLQEGQDPGDNQQQIQKNLEQAKADLEQAQQELAREQMALVADRLKGYKERQDSLLAESERIHNKLLKKNQWSSDLQRSLKDSGISQSNLAKETDLVKENLAQSPVFEHILKKAKGAMDKAAEAIAERTMDRVAGDKLDKDQLDAENKDQERIVKLQKHAADRLGMLINALKENAKDQQAQQPPKKPDETGQKPGDGNAPAARGRPGDGIPPAAEIKALIEIQKEVRGNTKAFDERFPDRRNLNEGQQAELRALENEQAEISQLFNRLMNKNKSEKGDEP